MSAATASALPPVARMPATTVGVERALQQPVIALVQGTGHTDHPRALGRQHLGDRLADSAARPGHDRDPAGHFREGCLTLTVET
jgi:hypothetical protein